MILRNLVIISAFLLASCNSRTIYKKPDNLIPKDQMVELWTEIYIAHAARSVKNVNQQQQINYMPFIQEKYKIDSVRFMQSNIYYTSKIEVYEELFKKVESRLKALRDTYDPDMAGIDPNLPIWKRDSIVRARKLQEKNKETREKILKKK